MIQIRYDLSKYKWASVSSFVIRETTGKDEEIAANMAKAKGGMANTTEELVRLSIVEADGKPVSHPFAPFDSWNTRTRAFVLKAWSKLNTIDEKEAEDFLTGGEILPDSPSDGK